MEKAVSNQASRIVALQSVDKDTLAVLEKEDVETPQYVTVTINDEFVESGAFETTEVKDGDEIEFLYFMGGGAR